MLKIKRVYEKLSKEDGTRILIDRLWPRGVKKEDAKIDLWLKDLAPSDELRKWYGHDPKKWEEFKMRYKKELDLLPDELDKLISLTKKGIVTLVFAAKDIEHSNAFFLNEILRSKS